MMQRAARTEWRENWGVVLAATIGIAIAGVHYHVVGAMVKPLGESYGWNRGDVTLALTISSMLAPFTNIFSGWLTDRFGPRIVILFGIPLFGISYAMLGFVGSAIIAWYIGYGLFAVLNLGVSPVVWTTAVVQKFSSSRGLALAISLAGSGILVSIIPSIVYALVDTFGISGTFVVLGAAATLIMFVPAYFLIPKLPANQGGLATLNNTEPRLLPGLFFKQAVRGTRFWRMAVAFLIISTCIGTFIAHFQPMLTDAGMSRSEAAMLAIFIGPAMVFGRITTGLLLDKFEPRMIAAVAFLLPGVACLMLIGLSDSYLYAAVVAIIVGFGMGAEVDVVAYMTSHYFGLKRYGLIFGSLIGLYGVGVGAGSSIAGFAYDAFGTYDSILIILAGLAIFAATIIATMGKAPAFER